MEKAHCPMTLIKNPGMPRAVEEIKSAAGPCRKCSPSEPALCDRGQQMQACVAGQLQQWRERLCAAITQLTGPSVPVTVAFDNISVSGSCSCIFEDMHPVGLVLLQAMLEFEWCLGVYQLFC